ncbi:MAG: hypothetical protein R3C97_17965 [Geminicoccaceae bacterium]
MKLLANWHPVSRLVALSGPAVIAAILVGDLYSSEEPAGQRAALAVGTVQARSLETSTVGPMATLPVLIDDVTSFEAMVEQPLFSPVRRAAAGFDAFSADEDFLLSPEDLSPPTAYADGIELVGTLVRDGEVRALVTRAGVRRIESVAEGDVVEGWKIMAITETALEIRSEDGLVRKQLAFPRLADPADLTVLSAKESCATGDAAADTRCAATAENLPRRPSTASRGQAG